MTIDRPNKRAPDHVADYLAERAQRYLAKSAGMEMTGEVERFRHYSQALSMAADEIRAGMHDGAPDAP